MQQFATTCCLVLLIAYISVAHSACPNPPTQDNFQLQRFAGVWYEIAKHPALLDKIVEAGCVCTTMNYTFTGNATALAQFGCRYRTVTGKYSSIDAKLSTENATQPGKLAMTYATFPVSVNNYILYVDDSYENALLFDCGQVLIFKEYCLHVVSRRPTMERAIYDKIVAYAASIGFETSKLEATKQEGCW